MITEAINDWYTTRGKLETAERREKYGGHKLGPSNLSDCLRKQAFLLSGMEPEPLTPEALRTFELGHQRGARLEEIAKELWPDARTQLPISIPLGKFKLNGTVDLWIPSLRTVVDFKTIGSFGAGLLSSEGVSEEYALQVHAYRDALMPDPKPLVPFRCIVMYEAKDSDARKGVKAGQLIEMEVPWTEELETKYQNRLRELEGMLIRREQGNLDPTAYNELPLEPNGKKSWKCKFCSVGEERGGCYK